MEKIITKIVDGGEILDDIVNRFQLRPLCTLNDSGKYISKFVGIFATKDELLISCPKHLNYQGEDDIELIISCMLKASKYLGSSNNEFLSSNIPYIPYLFVLDYFQRFGVYKENYKHYNRGYDGNVDWGRTARQSLKIVSGNNLVFLPLIVNKKSKKDTFIGECMKFVINDGYENFGKYINRGEIIDGDVIDINSENLYRIIARLKEEKNLHFKDSEIKLIDAIIDYIQWKGSFADNSFFVTKNFENIWEVMVNAYLCENYYSYNSVNNTIVIRRKCRSHSFTKRREYVQSTTKINQNGVKYLVEYDHYCKEHDVVTLFDSKYYNEVKNANYKQISYHYFLMNRFNKQETPQLVINGLIIPTEGKYYSKVHLDRTDIDKVLIVEHYINLRDVMEDYI